MDNTTLLSSSKAARGLFYHFKSKTQRKRPVPSHSFFECFAMNKLHGVKAFAILLTVMNDSRHIRMLNLRGRPGLAQKSRTSSGIFRQLSADNLEGDCRIKNGVSRAIRHRHCSGTEYDRISIGIYFHLKVCVTQRTEPHLFAFANL